MDRVTARRGCAAHSRCEIERRALVWHDLHNLRHHQYTNIIKRDGSVLRDRGAAAIAAAHCAAFGKFAPYYARECVLFPLLAGPFFWKALVANVITESARDLWAAAIIYCGHVGTSEYPRGTRAKRRAAWYAMQVEAACNVRVPRCSSVCGTSGSQLPDEF